LNLLDISGIKATTVRAGAGLPDPARMRRTIFFTEDRSESSKCGHHSCARETEGEGSVLREPLFGNVELGGIFSRDVRALPAIFGKVWPCCKNAVDA
jgi:hypothetical protein